MSFCFIDYILIFPISDDTTLNNNVVGRRVVFFMKRGITLLEKHIYANINTERGSKAVISCHIRMVNQYF